MKVPKLERTLGIEVYASKSLGIGGRIRQLPEDFVVEEVLVDGSKAKISPTGTFASVENGRYLVCVLVKRDWDTLLAVKEIARRLGISHKRIQTAGMKDTKALTAQHISIYGVTPEQVSQVKIKDITLHPLCFSDEMVFSHLLLGNQFHILIRNVSHDSHAIQKRVENVLDDLSSLGGVPNFFGHQRFGTIRPVTHLVGSFLVRGDLEKAALSFLAQPSPYELPESREARKQLQDSHDFEEALRHFPRYLGYERLMLSRLAKQPKDFLGAFRMLPLKLRRLFVQAYQSFLFNRFLSERIKRAIPLNKAHIGDYVIKIDSHGLPTNESMQVTAQSLHDVEKALNEDRMRVAAPLIGFKQPPSEGIQGEIEREILKIENVAPKDFYISPMPEISALGRLRTFSVPIIDFSVEEIFKDLANPSKRNVRLSFTLHRGSYATVLLREFMKPKNLIKAGF